MADIGKYEKYVLGLVGDNPGKYSEVDLIRKIRVFGNKEFGRVPPIMESRNLLNILVGIEEIEFRSISDFGVTLERAHIKGSE